jgi:acetylornithine deacetylase/succinyl-diaminopimelate desuccinylase-like protein
MSISWSDHLTTLLEPLNPSSITRIPQESVGDFLLARWNEDAPGKPIMVMMHMDTVHPVGSLETMPVRSDDEGRLYGPGVADMKGGIAVAIAALQGLIERDELPNRPIWYLFTSDEETGSLHSQATIEELALQCALVLVMEFPTHEGALKTARKGVATYTVETRGRPSHAGNYPEAGINAILEMAQQIISISKLQDSAGRDFCRGQYDRRWDGLERHRAPRQRDDRRADDHPVRHGHRIHEELMDLRPKIPGCVGGGPSASYARADGARRSDGGDLRPGAGDCEINRPDGLRG